MTCPVRSCVALVSTLALVYVRPVAAQSSPGAPSSGKEAAVPAASGVDAGTRSDAATTATDALRETAVVVLVGDARSSSELVFVISELLLRQNVQPQFVPAQRFSPRELLDAGAGDTRVWVYIALAGPQRARLYFRGPLGQRVMLRELALRAGLDEVGRELIARVVEGATGALLHSQEGLSRAEAEVEVARSAPPDPEPPAETAVDKTPAVDAAPAAPAPARRQWLLGLRALGEYTGDDLGALFGIGLEVGWLLPRSDFPRLRVRLASESGISQSIEDARVEASLFTWPIRIGLDAGAVSGAHGAWLGAGAGVDIVRVAPKRAGDDTLTLTDAEIAALPAARAELRYELTVDQLQLSVAAVLDVAFARSHYDVIMDGDRIRVASPSRLRPGVAIGAAMAF